MIGTQPIAALQEDESRGRKPVMKLFRIRSFDEYTSHSARIAATLEKHAEFLRLHTPLEREPFAINGYSYTAQKQVDFLVDYQHASESGGVVWRERVCCPETYFNNRMRATFHLFDVEMEPYPDADIYITEQLTPIYEYFKKNYSKTLGSEFLGDGISKGCVRSDGIRNEDLCNLSFDDRSFDTVVSLDVFEHIPKYSQAFKECARVLKPGGRMMWSVPFISKSRKNSIRAKLVNGQIQNILPPEYHGDPLSANGILCFQHFGWEMLDEMKMAGFSDAYAICYESIPFGYFGGEQFMFFAIK